MVIPETCTMVDMDMPKEVVAVLDAIGSHGQQYNLHIMMLLVRTHQPPPPYMITTNVMEHMMKMMMILLSSHLTLLKAL